MYIEVYEACILIEKYHKFTLVCLNIFLCLNGQSIPLCSYYEFYWAKKLTNLFKSNEINRFLKEELSIAAFKETFVCLNKHVNVQCSENFLPFLVLEYFLWRSPYFLEILYMYW